LSNFNFQYHFFVEDRKIFAPKSKVQKTLKSKSTPIEVAAAILRLLLKDDALLVVSFDCTNRRNSNEYPRIPLHSRMMEAIYGNFILHFTLCYAVVSELIINAFIILDELERIQEEVLQANVERPESLVSTGPGRKRKAYDTEEQDVAVRFACDWDLNEAIIKDALMHTLYKKRESFRNKIAKQLS
jgi:hypothetical protein